MFSPLVKRVDFFFFFSQQKFINQSNFTRQQGTGYDLTCWQNTLCTAMLGKKNLIAVYGLLQKGSQLNTLQADASCPIPLHQYVCI